MLTLENVKQFLRIDTDEEDRYITALRNIAKETCENYLRQPLPTESIESIKLAQLLIISHYFEHRDGAPLPKAVYRLLDDYRNEVF